MQRPAESGSTAFPTVSTAGFEGESELRRFRRLTVAGVLARHISQQLGQPATLMDVTAAGADGAVRGESVAAAIVALDRLPAERLTVCGGTLTLEGDDLLELVLAADTVFGWPESVLAAQRVAIGRSQGAFVRFARADGGDDIEVFTTRPDTIFGASFVAVSLSHPVARLAPAHRLAEFQAECDAAADDPNAKIGIPLGIAVRNPFVPERLLPVWLANFVVDTYGTGAAGGCPSCDQRDLDFARRYGLDTPTIVCPPGSDPDTYEVGSLAHSGTGIIVNSGFLSGLLVDEAIDAAIARLADMGIGRPAVQYRRPSLMVAVESPDDQGDIHYRASHWQLTSAFLTAAALVVPPVGAAWRPHVAHVTEPELATRHLLDARVLLRALSGGQGTSRQEPSEEIVLIGQVSGSAGRSAHSGPAWADDAFRLAVLADTPPDRELEWQDSRYAVAVKFTESVGRLFATAPMEAKAADKAGLASGVAKTAERLADALRRRRLNTAVAAAREIVGEATAQVASVGLDPSAAELMASLLYALLPDLGSKGLVLAGAPAETVPAWPDLGRAAAASTVELAVQINGKKRGVVRVAPEADTDAVLAAVHADLALAIQLGGKAVRKVVVVPNRLVNLVV